MPHAQVCSLDWFPSERLRWVWWMLSSYRGIHTSSHTCGRPTSPPVSTARLITALTGGYWKSFLLDGCECYLSSDEDAVLLEVVGMRWFTTLPVGEANRGAIRPFKQHLVPLIVQANPEHICGYWGVHRHGLVCFIYLQDIPHSCYHISLKHTHTHTLTVSWLGIYEALLFYVADAGQVSSFFVACSQSIPPHHFIPFQVVAVTRIWNPVVGTEHGLGFDWRQRWKYGNWD